MRPIRPAVLSLGSNVGDRLANLQGAIDTLADTPEVHVVHGVVGLRDRRPSTPRGARPDFLNAILIADTTLSMRCCSTARRPSRRRSGASAASTNAPRTLDVDLIVVGDRLSDTEELTLPHPRAHERAFVLVPWHEIDEQAVIPGKGKIADLLSGLDTSTVVRRDDLELEVSSWQTRGRSRPGDGRARPQTILGARRGCSLAVVGGCSATPCVPIATEIERRRRRRSSGPPSVRWSSSPAVLFVLAFTTYRTVHRERRRMEPQRAVELPDARQGERPGRGVRGRRLPRVRASVRRPARHRPARERFMRGLVASVTGVAIVVSGASA